MASCRKASGNETVNNGQPWLQKLTRRPIHEHSGIFQKHLQAEKTLGTAEVRESVKLPRGIEVDEWIAAKVFLLRNEVEMVVCLLDDLCDEEVCTNMTAGKYTSYSWACEDQPVPLQMPAKQYMERLILYADKVLSNPDIVPADGRPLPECFRDAMKKLLKRFFRVYAHAYLHHFEDIQTCDCEAHLNCCFKHFLFFVREFDLVSMEDMGPLLGLVQKFLKQGRQPALTKLPATTVVDLTDGSQFSNNEVWCVVEGGEIVNENDADFAHATSAVTHMGRADSKLV